MSGLILQLDSVCRCYQILLNRHFWSYKCFILRTLMHGFNIYKYHGGREAHLMKARKSSRLSAVALAGLLLEICFQKMPIVCHSSRMWPRRSSLTLRAGNLKAGKWAKVTISAAQFSRESCSPWLSAMLQFADKASSWVSGVFRPSLLAVWVSPCRILLGPRTTHSSFCR